MQNYIIEENAVYAGKILKDNFSLLLTIFKKYFSLLCVSSLFIGGTGFFKTYMAYVMMGIAPDIQMCAVGFLLTFSVYSLNKLTDLKEDAINMPERLSFLAGRKKLVMAYSIGAYLLSAVLALMSNPLAIFVVIIPIIANFFYSSRIIPGMPRLKDIPVMKNAFVAASWASCATLLPALQSWSTVGLIFPLVLCFIFTKSLVNTIIYDVRDVKGDRENGVRTIPVLLGEKKTALLLLAMNTSLLVWALLISCSVKPLLLAMIIYGYIYILYFREKRNPMVLDFFVDGEWMHTCLLFIALQSLPLLA